MSNNINLARQIMNDATDLYKDRRYEDAINSYLEAIDIFINIEQDETKKHINVNDSICVVYYNISTCFIKIRDFQNAVKYGEESSKRKKRPNTLYNLAFSYVHTGKLDLALAAIKESYALDPEDKQIETLYKKLTKAFTINPILEALK